ncbi:hypothetical protein BW13_06810 [Bifidobacterium sp. UTCIF-37]|nr:TIGR03943 family protein [Bifidobacterium sp. UTCIF-37]TPF86197.1 hypothetical protein BW13_06810 [Bifidobacterium sp. UTCIF-37]TPF88441.1 hypothetical protein BW11_07465 [Bifidobacterium sp. UTCIF-38]
MRGTRIFPALRHTHDDFMRMMPILLFGTIIASIMRTGLSSLTSESNRLDDASAIVLILVAMGLAFLCSLCSTSDAVIAASMTGVLPVSAMLAFLIFGAVLLFVLTIAAWLGLFHTTERASLRASLRLLVALIIPALLIAVPFQPISGSGGFDEYAGGRAIAIPRSSHKPEGASQLHGLDAAKKTITISDDEFGSWFEQIDHNPQRYVDYHVRVTGFVSKSRTFDADEFELSRQFMSCCILDMSPFGFMASSGKTGTLHNHDWVSVDAVIKQGRYGSAGHERQGLILRVQSVSKAATAPNGYFYWQ